MFTLFLWKSSYSYILFFTLKLTSASWVLLTVLLCKSETKISLSHAINNSEAGVSLGLDHPDAGTRLSWGEETRSDGQRQ